MKTEGSMQQDTPNQKDHKIDETSLEELLQQSVLLNVMEMESFAVDEVATVENPEAGPDQVKNPELAPVQAPDPLFAMEMPMEKNEQSTEISRAKKELDEYMSRNQSQKKPSDTDPSSKEQGSDRRPWKHTEKISLRNKEKASREKESLKEKTSPPTGYDEKRSWENTMKMMPKKAKKTPSKLPRKASPGMTPKSKPVSEKDKSHQNLKIRDLKLSTLKIKPDLRFSVNHLQEEPKPKKTWDLRIKKRERRYDGFNLFPGNSQ